MGRRLKTQWLKASRSLIVACAGCLFIWAQTQPADKPDASGKPAPVSSAAAAAGDLASQHKDSEITKAPPQSNNGSIQILSDTAGVDFGPYAKRLKALVQDHWYASIPASAMPPTMKRGRVLLEFVIMKDGSVRALMMVHSSGDVELDRAAWGAITSSAPLPPLPAVYTKDHILLRTTFYYNSDPADAAQSPAQTPTPQPAKPDPKN